MCPLSSFSSKPSEETSCLMRGRHVSRECAFKVLYEIDVRGPEALDELIKTIPRQLDDEESQQFCETLVVGCIEKGNDLLDIVGKQTTHWEVKRLATTDRVLLTIGLFELIYLKHPAAVVIDESIELAKKYGGLESPAFINGVLDSWHQAQHG